MNKNYRFKIIPEDKSVSLKKKQFTISSDCEDIADVFNETIYYLEEHISKFITLYDDEYINLKLVRGKLFVDLAVDIEFCSCCGGTVEIYREGGNVDVDKK